MATLPAPCSAMCRPSRLSLPSARFTAALMPRNTPSEVCGPGSPPTSPRRIGKAGDELGRARDLDHVGDAHADVLGGDVAAAKMRRPPCRTRAACRASWCASCVGQDHRLAAAERQARHGVLVAHAARQPQRVGQRLVVLGIMPEAGAAGRGAEVGRMDGDDRPQAALLVGDEMHVFVRVEIGQAPGRGHGVECPVLRKRKMGRSRGLEPPTPGTTNQCSNQLSYDRHGASWERFPCPRGAT